MKLLIILFALLLLQQNLAKDNNVKSRKHQQKHKISNEDIAHGPAVINGIQPRLSPPRPICWESCDSTVVGPSGDKLSFFYRKDLIGIVNETANFAFIIDLKHKKNALLNGNIGSGGILSIPEEEAWRAKFGLWLARKESFTSYFMCLKDLEKLWAFVHKTGYSVTGKNITRGLLIELYTLLSALSGKIAVELKHNVKDAFNVLITVSNRLVTNWGGPLRWILDGSGTIENSQFDGGLEIFLGLSDGLREFFANVKGGVKILIDANIKLDLERILRAKSGSEIFIIIDEDIDDKIDLSHVLGIHLSSKSRILRLTSLLNGQVSTNLRGLEAVITRISALLERTQPAVHKLIETLLRFSWSKGVNFSTIPGLIQRHLDVNKKQIQKFNNAKALSNFTEIVEGYKNRKLIIGGVDLYLAVERLQSVGTVNGIRLTVQILKILRPSLSITRSVSILLLEILNFLENDVEAEILARLIPGFKLEYNSNGQIIIIERIKSLIKTDDLKPVLNDIYKLLLRVPVIADIVKFLDRVLMKEKIASLSVILKRSHSHSAVVGIVNWLKVNLNINANIEGVTNVEAVNNRYNSESSSSSNSEAIKVNGGVGGSAGSGASIGIGIGDYGIGIRGQIETGANIGFNGSVGLPVSLAVRLSKKDGDTDLKKHDRRVKSHERRN